MCLALPMEVVSIEGARALVRAGGMEMTAALDLVEGVAEGDFVIVHAGYAIQVLPPDEAQETLAILGRLRESREAS